MNEIEKRLLFGQGVIPADDDGGNFKSAIETLDMQPYQEMPTGKLRPISDCLDPILYKAASAMAFRFDAESPIEVIFGASMQVRMLQFYGERFRLVPQFLFRGYRMDWAVCLGDMPLAFVECDGAAFHSMPEQIENDRRKDWAAADAHIKMFRFTGSEIFRNDEACVSAVITYLAGR